MQGLNGRVALVTGGGGAIGRAIGERLAQAGVTVGLVDLEFDRASEAAREIVKNRGSAQAIAADITDYDGVKRAVAEFDAQHGPVDILVNNAGWDLFGNFLNTSPEFWEKIVRINYLGALNLHHAVLPQMVERRIGRIVNICSDAARVGSSGEAVYAGCKAALIAFGKTVAREVAGVNVTVNAVCPGPTDTPMFRSFVGDNEQGHKVAEALKRAIPMKRLGKPEDIAGIVAFLASDEAGFITGQVISVSGGLTMHG